ncbi:hypothetical protein EES42_42700 [Streptomyces sp. ADI95-17]|nr:hypothetical protein EES42_42700 [Streptomyces sp. ADI95-17]
MNAPGVDITVTPPASAIVHSPLRRAWTARWRATSDDEHAVSIVIVGPSRPKVYATRPDRTLPDVPIPRKPSTPSGTEATCEA